MEDLTEFLGIKISKREKKSIAKEATKEGRTMSSYIRWLHNQHIKGQVK